MTWLERRRYRRLRRQRDRRKAEALTLLMGRPPTRRVSGRMARMLRGDR